MTLCPGRCRSAVLLIWVAAAVSGGCEPGQSAERRMPARLEPEILFSTYFGGTAGDTFRDVAIDAAGNIYVAGGTTSANLPVTRGTFGQRYKSNGKEQDAFIAKFSRDGRLLWATYLGGPYYDRVYGIEVDAQGYVYVAGRAGADFPVTEGALQTRFAGSPKHEAYGEQDGFVCKIKPDASAIVFCTYFGDRDGAPIRDLALDPHGNIYVVASSEIGELPQEWFAHAYQKTIRGRRDLVIAKIVNDGSRVEWATYLGGSDIEFNTTSIRVDEGGNSYVVTTTRSSDAPVPNGFDTELNGESDIYVAKLAPDGSQLLWGSYYGGSDREFTETHEIAIDSAHQVYIAAMTNSVDLPVTPNAYQATFGGLGLTRSQGRGTNYSGDAFVAKISASGDKLLASTYLGGSAGDGIEGVSVDQHGHVYVSGGTYSKDLKTAVASPRGPGNESDMFVARLNHDLSAASVVQFGGDSHDVIRSSCSDGHGNSFIVGETSSARLPVRRAVQDHLRGRFDAVIAAVRFP